jgi:predicted ATP-grasp superfamily ATP-dependent carboligase
MVWNRLTVIIEIRELAEIHLRGGVLIDCISGTNHESSRVGRYLIQELNMEQIAILESDQFPSICTIVDGKPSFPMRVYSNQSSKLAVIVSDFIPGASIEKSLGKSIVSWAKSKSIALILTFYQVSPPEIGIDLGAACSTKTAKMRLEQSRIDLVNSVRITGLPAVLLNEGNWLNMDVISLILQSVHSGKHSSSVAERLVQGIDILLPEIKFDVRKLYPSEIVGLSFDADRKTFSNTARDFLAK